MRRYNILSVILLTLPIINFALAAPVLLKDLEDSYAEAEKEVKEHFRTWGITVTSESSYARESSSSTSPEPEHGSTSVVLAPPPNRVSSAPDLNSLTRPSRQSLSGNRVNAMSKSDDLLSYKGDDNSHWQYTPTSSGYSSDREFMEAHAHGLQPNHPMSWTDSDSLSDPDVDWGHWTNSENSPPPRPASPEEFGQAHKYQVDPLNPPSASGYAPSPPEPEPEVATPSPPSSNLGQPSLSADSQPVDAQAAAMYAAKGKAKVSRGISGTTRDGENAARKELRPAERSPDPGE